MSRSMIMSTVIGFIFLFVLGAAILLSPAVEAQTGVEGALAPLGTGFTFQGELKDGGSPVSAKCDMQFALYNAATKGNQVGTTQTVMQIDVDSGRFSTTLNDSAEFGSNAFVGDARWLAISVRCPTGTGSYTALNPRQELTAAPYAIYATTAGTMPWSGLTGLSCSPSQMVIWDSSKWICSEANDHNHGGQSWIGAGPYGLEIENTSQIDFTSGLTGVSSGSTGKTKGVLGLAASPQGSGVRGQSIGIGVVGQTDSSIIGNGVLGLAPQPAGMTTGVVGSSNSVSGKGVWGYVDVTTGSDAVGVYGETSAPGGRGVVGYATNLTGNNAGVYGKTDSPNGWAGYFVGGLGVEGNLLVFGDIGATGAKTFQIDHPLDPDNKWLRHAAVESPAMMNVYNGNVTLDVNGEAWVQLPDYFESLNKDFRYQLTPIGASGPNLFIAERIAGNQFKIAGGAANLEVSWQVTGVRQDAYAVEHPLIVEEEKPAGVNSVGLPQPQWDDSDRSSIEAWIEQMEYPQEGQGTIESSEWTGQ